MPVSNSPPHVNVTEKCERTDVEWAHELNLLGIQACGFWKLDQKGRTKFLEFVRHLHEEDKKKEELASRAPLNR